MSYTLFVDNNKGENNIALCYNNKLLEFNNTDNDSIFSVGDIHVGEVKKIVPGLNSCFVNLGSGKDGFLHYHDLGPQILSFSKIIQNKKAG